MRDPHSRSFLNLQFAPWPATVCSALLILLLSSCSADLPMQSGSQQAGDDSPALAYSIVCIIHGDGNYVYHDTEGNEYKADEETLAEAKKVAEQNPRAEVFIFHQRSKSSFLFFFPIHDGEFLYYRNGQLVAHETYSREKERSRFDPEVELYHRFTAGNQHEMVNMFFYFGHEIPEFDGVGYDASYLERMFTVHDLANGLRGFTRDAGPFELLVLSTCFGGTPYTISALGSFARYIIASPENLHLSYFDLHSLAWLHRSLRQDDVRTFSNTFARKAFDRLTGEVQTTVSVSMYDVDRVQEFLQSVRNVYDRTLISIERRGKTSGATFEHCDCADLPAYTLPTISDGVTVFYRSARFGRSKDKQNHSGWGCWMEKVQQTTTTEMKESVVR